MKIVILLNSLGRLFAHKLYLSNAHKLHGSMLSVVYAWMNGYSTLLHNIAPGKYVLKRVSLGSKDCTKELKLECAYFLGQTS